MKHFDLIYEQLGYNAQILFAIGEDLRIYRPTVFGPSPLKIKKEVNAKHKFRLMVHTAEDITAWVLKKDYNYKPLDLHSDVKHGFVLAFTKKPDVKIKELEKKIKILIEKDISIKPTIGNYFEFKGDKIFCTSKRSHVKSTAQIERFRLVKDFKYDPISKEYLLIGLVGKESVFGFKTLPPVEPDVHK